ncbi:TM56B protein, partial [Centropus unirufus]|nr:TM56B protein [Centropus unirufus]
MASFSPPTIGIAVASFTVFHPPFHVLSSWVSTRITPPFNSLSQKRKIEWNPPYMSTFHALVVGGFSPPILVYDDAVNADRPPPGMGDPSIVPPNIAITTGYLISDLLLIIYYCPPIGDKFFVIHHLAAPPAYYFVLSKGLLAYFGNFPPPAEFSTPFVNQRWFFEVLGSPPSSKANIVNGVLMTPPFFVVRIAVMPIYSPPVISSFGTEAFQRPPPAAQSAWIISSVVSPPMNVMWMVKIAKGSPPVISLIGLEEAKTPPPGKSD